jgi:hypothetical protein
MVKYHLTCQDTASSALLSSTEPDTTFRIPYSPVPQDHLGARQTTRPGILPDLVLYVGQVQGYVRFLVRIPGVVGGERGFRVEQASPETC